MNYLFAFKESSHYMNNWQYAHIIDSLEKLGSKCHVVLYKSSQDTFSFENEIKDIANNNKIDIFFTAFNHKIIGIKILQTLRKLNVKTVLFCPDNLLFPYRHKKIAKYYDLVWLTSNETKYLFDRWKANSIFLPYAANPDIKKKTEKRKIIRKIVFVGNPYGSRANVINYLTSNKVPVVIYHTLNNKEILGKKYFKTHIKKIHTFYVLLKNSIGRKILLSRLLQNLTKKSKLDTKSQYLTIKDSLSIHELSNIYSRYALSLSFSSARNTDILSKPVKIVNLRSFEIPAFQGIQLVRKTDEISRYYQCAKEIVCYENKLDLLERIDYYLNTANDSELYAIQNQGYARTQEEHRWTARFEFIEKILK